MRSAISIFACASLFLLAGCATTVTKFQLNAPKAAVARIHLVDKLKSPDAPNWFIGEGNVFSCHYEIRRLSDTFEPDKATVLHDYLATVTFNDQQPHTVVAKRFDVYLNRHAESEDGIWSSGFVLPGSGGATVVPGVHTLPTDPGQLVGCEGANAGEYYVHEVPKYVSPVITYLNLVVDGQPVDVRSIYAPAPGDELSERNSIIPSALQKAFTDLRGALDGAGSKGVTASASASSG